MISKLNFGDDTLAKDEDNQKRAKEGNVVIYRIEPECWKLDSVQIKERGLVNFPNLSTFPAFQEKTGGHQRSSRRSSFKGPASNWNGLKDPQLRSTSYVMGIASAVYFIFDLVSCIRPDFGSSACLLYNISFRVLHSRK